MPKIKLENFTLNYELHVIDRKLPLLVFLHGFNSSLLALKAIATSSERRYNSLLIDLPGFGESTSKSPIGFKELTIGITELFFEIKLEEYYNVMIIGHSLGGALTTWILNFFSFVKFGFLFTPLSYYTNFSKEEAKKLEKILLPQNFEEAITSLSAIIPKGISFLWDQNLETTAKILLESLEKRRPFISKLVYDVILNKDFLKTKLKRYYKGSSGRSVILQAESEHLIWPNALEEASKECKIPLFLVQKSAHGIFFENTTFFVEIFNKICSFESIHETTVKAILQSNARIKIN